MKQGIIFDWVGTVAEQGEGRAHILAPYAEEVLEVLAGRYRLAVISKTKNPGEPPHPKGLPEGKSASAEWGI